MTSTQTIEPGRWYRYWKPDGTSIELKKMDGKSYIDREGSEHTLSVIRELHATKPVEPLDDELNWPT